MVIVRKDPESHEGGRDRALQDPAHRLQAAAPRRVPRRLAEDADRQGPAARAARRTETVGEPGLGSGRSPRAQAMATARGNGFKAPISITGRGKPELRCEQFIRSTPRGRVVGPGVDDDFLQVQAPRQLAEPACHVLRIADQGLLAQRFDQRALRIRCNDARPPARVTPAGCAGPARNRRASIPASCRSRRASALASAASAHTHMVAIGAG